MTVFSCDGEWSFKAENYSDGAKPELKSNIADFSVRIASLTHVPNELSSRPSQPIVATVNIEQAGFKVLFDWLVSCFQDRNKYIVCSAVTIVAVIS